METAGESRRLRPGSEPAVLPEVPTVSVVLIAHDPADEHFDATLSSFARQDYPRLDVLVVDAAGSVDRRAGLAALVRHHLPNATLQRGR